MSESDRRVVRDLADLLDERRLSEIEYERDGLRIRVVRGAARTASRPEDPEPSVPPPPAAERREADESVRPILSPMVGTFYAAPSPESADFVQVGDRVRKGQVVCIIEAMKLMNEIESDHEGVLARRLVENAHGVEFGQALFEVAVD